VEHLRPGKVLAEHFRPKKSFLRKLAFLYEFQNLKKIGGTLVFHGTVVGNH